MSQASSKSWRRGDRVHGFDVIRLAVLCGGIITGKVAALQEMPGGHAGMVALGGALPWAYGDDWRGLKRDSRTVKGMLGK